MNSKVSVIIPCYRCADTIDRAVDSVLCQTLLPNEIILVDDCSDDGGATQAALHALQCEHTSIPIRIVTLAENCGPGGARNAGWAVAQGRYLAFLDADDSWHPSKLQIQIAWMQDNPHAILSATGTSQMQYGDMLMPLNLPPKVYRVSGRKLLFSNCFPMRTVVLCRDITLRFDPVKRYAEDYLLWLRIVLSGMPAYVLDLPLGHSYKPEFGANGLSANLWRMERGEIDTYQRLCAEGLLSKFSSYGTILFSLMKFARRLLLSKMAGGRSP